MGFPVEAIEENVTLNIINVSGAKTLLRVSFEQPAQEA